MALLDLVALPVELAVAATSTTLALGTLVAPDGPVRCPERYADRLIQPRIAELIALIPDLHDSVDTLNRAVGPLSDLANRIPGGRRRPALEA
ncbi:MAG: hypothetical protein ABIO66_07480 [Nocardioidaceae bacterium]